MPIQSYRLAAIVAMSAVALASCGRDARDAAALLPALHREYPQTRVDLMHGNQGRLLSVTFDNSSARTLPDSVLTVKGRAIAAFVLAQYPAPADLDSIVLMFVREREDGFLSSSFTAFAMRFATKDLH